ncbi:histone-lysine N-methyltransferase SMYD3 isoform X1 [Pangasianodon hypophthalmus]|uniref:histone-lysine N-methyltransferase SMYD3 isoform X1 n=1 Tax=Pangasianodon hypophthalmus TaxID=310915 RepID=UPI002308008F|nr:histone-lysine N-methyltransferase SMYD3 isoform X1 [Pangasianodon hypophthalmus]
MAASASVSSEEVKVERFISPGRGNGLRARTEIKPGQLIYSSQPIAFCVAQKFLKSTCQTCLCRGESLLRCSQCKSSRFCSVQCQKEAWPEHKRECKCLQRVYPRVPTDSVRLVARIIFTLLNDPAADSQELYSITQHQSHLDEMSEEKREGLVQLCSMLKLYLDSDVPQLPSGLDPMSLIARVMCNCFSVSDGELQDVGLGLYPSMSLLNHDCRPNCVMMFVGKKLELRAVRRIQPFEELCISYTDILAPRVERRAQLMDQFYFLCQCQRCSDDQSDCTMLGGEESRWTIIRDSLPHLETLRHEEKWAELKQACQALIGENSAAVPDSNVYMLRVLDSLMDACISLSQYETALQYGTRTLIAYLLHYPDPHPSHAVELLRVAKLQHYSGDVEQAERTFTQAYDVMKVTHGSDHPLVSEVCRKLAECQAERRRL